MSISPGLRCWRTWTPDPCGPPSRSFVSMLNDYMGKEYERTGRMVADPHSVGKKHPMVYVRPSGQWDILSGHHPATAALLEREALRARVIRQPDEPS